MSSSRIVTAASLATLLICACSGPGYVSNNPGVSPQTSSANSALPPAAAPSAELAPDYGKVKLFCRPDRLGGFKGRASAGQTLLQRHYRFV